MAAAALLLGDLAQQSLGLLQQRVDLLVDDRYRLLVVELLRQADGLGEVLLGLLVHRGQLLEQRLVGLGQVNGFELLAQPEVNLAHRHCRLLCGIDGRALALQTRVAHQHCGAQ